MGEKQVMEKRIKEKEKNIRKINEDIEKLTIK
jgi:hypothetical protein